MNAISPAPHIYPSTVTTALHRVIRDAHRMDQRALVGGSPAEAVVGRRRGAADGGAARLQQRHRDHPG
jgi:hypothetical protein